jgi:hypothetical protein
MELILAFVNVDMRPDVLAFSYHAGLSSSQTEFDESRELLGMRNAEIN